MWNHISDIIKKKLECWGKEHRTYITILNGVVYWCVNSVMNFNGCVCVCMCVCVGVVEHILGENLKWQNNQLFHIHRLQKSISIFHFIIDIIYSNLIVLKSIFSLKNHNKYKTTPFFCELTSAGNLLFQNGKSNHHHPELPIFL